MHPSIYIQNYFLAKKKKKGGEEVDTQIEKKLLATCLNHIILVQELHDDVQQSVAII